jgi:MerT mercuric transport protein
MTTQDQKKDWARQSQVLVATTTGAGSALLAMLASACCISPILAPLIVSVIGVSGAVWIAGIRPYSPYIFGVSFLLLLYGYWIAYWQAPNCDGESCRVRPKRNIQISLWAAAILWAVSLISYLYLSILR